MNLLEQKIADIEKFENDVTQIVITSLRDNANIIIDMNTDQLNRLGEDSTGEAMGDYTPFSANIRKGENLQTDHIDLNFTGAWQKAFYVKVGNESLFIDSSDPKTRKLEKRFGKRIFGLQDYTDIIDIVREILIDIGRQRLL